MKKIETIDELKSIQLGILEQIHLFCIEHNIHYSLACGSLLGAIRHKGFIPWDDDIDIQLLRDDYNKLLSLFPSEHENISLISIERDDRWNRSYARAYDNRTKEVECVHGNIEWVGVGIDVYPIDKVPNDYSEWKIYNKKRLFLLNVYQIKIMKWSSKRNIFKNLFILFCQLFIMPFTIRTLAKLINRMAQKHNNEISQFVFESCQGVIKGRDRFLLDDFNGYIDCDFETYKFKIISGYDDYLKQTYGDYMTLPPIDKRVNHHTFNAWWK